MLRLLAASTLDELPSWAADLLAGARVGRLGFLDERARPRVLPVTFARAGEALYSAIDEKPKRSSAGELARVRYLRRRPYAALCVDRYDDDWSRLAWVQLLGSVEIREPGDELLAMRELGAKYAPYRERPPGGPLLRLDAERALHWRASA